MTIENPKDQIVKKPIESTTNIRRYVAIIDGILTDNRLLGHLEVIDSLKVFSESERETKKLEVTKQTLERYGVGGKGREELTWEDMINSLIRHTQTRVRSDASKKPFVMQKVEALLPYLRQCVNTESIPGTSKSVEGDIRLISDKVGSSYPYIGKSMWDLKWRD